MKRILTGAAGAIMKDGEILLVKHRLKNLWQIPGGAQEVGESLEETIVREVGEELGLAMEIDSLVSVFSSSAWDVVFPDGHEIQQVTLFFLLHGVIDEREIRIQEEEITEYGFFDLDRIPDDTFPCCKEKVKLLKEFFRTRKIAFR